jgi:hypothetical protein
MAGGNEIAQQAAEALRFQAELKFNQYQQMFLTRRYGGAGTGGVNQPGFYAVYMTISGVGGVTATTMGPVPAGSTKIAGVGGVTVAPVLRVAATARINGNGNVIIAHG